MCNTICVHKMYIRRGKYLRKMPRIKKNKRKEKKKNLLPNTTNSRVCVYKLDGEAMLVADTPPANSTIYTDTHPRSYGKPNYWLY